jgi:ubiquinol-cytochrome c reductase cytochrome b subunit
MIHSLVTWLDNRTGIRHFTREALLELIPGGARWRYITGSMLVFAFVTQAITGVFLWMYYSPSSQNAYESVYWIQNEVSGGWLLRGIHHFMAQAMVALLPLHLLQVVVDKAYRAPREFNFWTGLVLMLLTLGLSLTGYLLPWDQKGYWATKVATNLMAMAPEGESMQKLVVGGTDYGHYTLTRFFALHTGVLPALLVGVLVLHLTLFRRHGITAVHPERRPAETFFPYQVFKDGVACLVMLLAVILVTIHFDVGGVITGSADVTKLGADLGPPADPVQEYKAPRPEWYFRFLFQFLKLFEEAEFFGAIVAPALVVGYLFLMPFIGNWKIGHYLNVTVLLVLLVGIIYLTAASLYEDNYAKWFEFDPKKYAEGSEQFAEYEDLHKSSKDYLDAVENAEKEYARVRELVDEQGIPPDGILALMQKDPAIQGPRLFEAKCASCHSYLDGEGHGIAGPPPSSDGTPNGAPNLYGFASRAWIRGLLDPERIVNDHYFGRTIHGARRDDGDYPSGGMVEFVRDTLVDLDEDQQQALEALVVALSHEAALPYQQETDQAASANGTLEQGREALVSEFSCVDCHKFRDDGDLGTAPDLTGYGSKEWIKLMIADPEHERMYEAGNDRMPAFAANPDSPLLSDQQIEMLAEWLRSEGGSAQPADSAAAGVENAGASGDAAQ